MKKTLALTLALGMLLTGCGKADGGDSDELQIATDTADTTEAEGATEAETELFVVPAVTTEAATETVTTDVSGVSGSAETTTTTAAETAETTTTTATEDTTAPTTTAAAGEVDAAAVKSAYKETIQGFVNKAKTIGDGSFSDVTYTLYDMDKDGVPELLVKYGTCEADYRIAVCTYRDGAVKTVTEELGGGHTSFAFDYSSGQLVLCYGHMGYGNMVWYELGEGDTLNTAKDLGGFSFGPDADYEYGDYLYNYHISWLTISEFMGDYTTWVISYPEGEYYGVEYGGYDYTYLDNYEF